MEHSTIHAYTVIIIVVTSDLKTEQKSLFQNQWSTREDIHHGKHFGQESLKPWHTEKLR